MTERPCPNCGEPSPGRYCPACGQRQGGIPTLREWLSEVIDELLLVESRLPRTLRAVIWPPGYITREWWEGKRVSFVSPVRLYLLAAVPFFFFLAQRTLRRPLAGDDLLGLAVAVSYLESRPEAYNEPLGPLPAERANDSVARAQWRAEFERRREENEAISGATDRTIREGIRNLFGILPIAVGVVMVPLLAVLLAAGAGGAHRFVARIVFSLHLHAIGYVLVMLGWLMGAGAAVGLGVSGIYLAMARRRVLGESWTAAALVGVTLPVVYLALFLTIYVGVVQGLAWAAPWWVFAKA
jgi:hypothetical protein